MSDAVPRPHAMRRAALVLSVALIMAVTLLPLSALHTDQPPELWCLACGGLWLSDAISNIGLFIPVGAALAALGVPWLRIVAMTCVGSLGIEYLQSLGFPPLRSAALADVIANTLGGLLGALLYRSRQLVVTRSVRVACTLAISSALASIATFTVTSAALGLRVVEPRFDDHPVRSPVVDSHSDVQYRRSTFSYSPGFGWFGGFVDSASVGGYSATQVGSGPIVVEASAEPDSVVMSVAMHGRQDSTWFKPMLFVHRRGDTVPVVFVAERDRDAVLAVSRRARDWGLAMPSLTVPDVFQGRTPNDARPLHIDAIATTSRLHLESRTATDTRQRTLRLVPTLGWAMIQTFIGIDSPFAMFARVSWLALLVAPMGWWGAACGRRWWCVVSGVAVALALVLGEILPRRYGVAPPAMSDWSIMTALLLCAVAGSRRALRHR